MPAITDRWTQGHGTFSRAAWQMPTTFALPRAHRSLGLAPHGIKPLGERVAKEEEASPLGDRAVAPAPVAVPLVHMAQACMAHGDCAPLD